MAKYSYTIHGSNIYGANETMKQFEEIAPATLDQFPTYLKELHDIIEAHLTKNYDTVDLIGIATDCYLLGLIHAGKGISIHDLELT